MCRPCSFPRPSAAGFHFCWLAALGSSNNSCFQVFRHNSSEGNWAIGRSLPHAVGLFQSEGRVKSKGPEHNHPGPRQPPILPRRTSYAHGRDAEARPAGLLGTSGDSPRRCSAQKAAAEPCHIGPPGSLVGVSDMALRRVRFTMCQHITSHASPWHAAAEAGENRAVARLAQKKSPHGTTTDPPMQD